MKMVQFINRFLFFFFLVNVLIPGNDPIPCRCIIYQYSSQPHKTAQFEGSQPGVFNHILILFFNILIPFYLEIGVIEYDKVGTIKLHIVL